MKKRDDYFDNVRLFLIFLVVFGHLLRPYVYDSPLFYAVYMTIYAFHMPAFIFISGFFAKGIQRPGYLKKAAVKLLVPLVLFQLIYSVFYFFIEQKKTLSIDFLIPEWSLWFLLSLFFWHCLLLFTVQRLKPKQALLLAVAAGLLISIATEPLALFSIGRTFVFFPFFLAGYYVQKEWFQPLFRLSVKLPLFAAAALLFVFFFFHPAIRIEWLFGSKSYAFLETDILTGMLLRLLIYAMSVMMIAFYFSIVTKKPLLFTSWGRNTLYVYLLHGFFIQSFRRVDSLALPPSLLALFAAAAVLTLMLASPLTASLFAPLLEQKKPGFLMKKEN